jgi:hypothetical protein
VADLPLYPSGRTLDPQLASQLTADWAAPSPLRGFPRTDKEVAGVFADLDGDGIEEFVLLGLYGGPVYQKRSGRWEYVGQVHPQGDIAHSYSPSTSFTTVEFNFPSTSDALRADLNSGKIAAASPRWRELVVGAQRFQLDEDPRHLMRAAQP